VDPKAVEFIHQSSYVFAGNNPVKYIDLNGVEQVSFDEMLTEIDSKVQEKIGFDSCKGTPENPVEGKVFEIVSEDPVRLIEEKLQREYDLAAGSFNPNSGKYPASIRQRAVAMQKEKAEAFNRKWTLDQNGKPELTTEGYFDSQLERAFKEGDTSEIVKIWLKQKTGLSGDISNSGMLNYSGAINIDYAKLGYAVTTGLAWDRKHNIDVHLTISQVFGNDEGISINYVTIKEGPLWEKGGGLKNLKGLEASLNGGIAGPRGGVNLSKAWSYNSENGNLGETYTSKSLGLNPLSSKFGFSGSMRISYTISKIFYNK